MKSESSIATWGPSPLQSFLHACRVLLGAVFILAAFLKSFAPESLYPVFQFDQIPSFLFIPTAWMVVLVELLVGSMLLFRIALRIASVTALILLILFTIQLVVMYQSDNPPNCSCFGLLREYEARHTQLAGAIVRDIVLLAMAIVVVWSEFLPQEMRWTPRVKARTSGFTVIELIAVVMIVSLLLALLLPTLSRMRAAGAKTNCASNLRQLFGAAAMYSNANNGWIPRTASYWHTEYGSWPLLLQPYLNMKTQFGESTLRYARVFACPAHPLQDIPTSYVMNSAVFDSQNALTGDFIAGPVKLASIRQSSGVAYLLEADDVFNLPPNPDVANDKEGIYGIVFHTIWHPRHLPHQSGHRISDSRHGATSNVVYCDGHLGDVKKGEFDLNTLDDGIRNSATKYSSDPTKK